jgi:hypothetical protein
MLGIAVETTVCSSEQTVIASIKASVTNPRRDLAISSAPLKVAENRIQTVSAFVIVTSLLPSAPFTLTRLRAVRMRLFYRF